MRDVQTTVDSYVPWKLNPLVFSGDSSDYLYFRKEAIVFSEYVGSGDVFTCLREVPVADPLISVQQIRGMYCTNDEIDLHRKAC